MTSIDPAAKAHIFALLKRANELISEGHTATALAYLNTAIEETRRAHEEASP